MAECIDYKIDRIKEKGIATLPDYLDAALGVASGEMSMEYLIGVMEYKHRDVRYVDRIFTPFIQAHKEEFCAWVKIAKEKAEAEEEQRFKAFREARGRRQHEI